MENKYTKNFSIQELKCKCDVCKGANEAQMQLGFMVKLQKLRDILDMPLTVTCGHRCEAHNQAVGGVKGSYHVKGRAVDIRCLDSRFRADIITIALELGFYGIGVYKNFIHLDDRPYSKRSLFRGKY